MTMEVADRDFVDGLRYICSAVENRALAAVGYDGLGRLAEHRSAVGTALMTTGVLIEEETGPDIG